MSLDLESVSRSYGAVRALHEVTCTIPPGRIVAVIGANGAGKSTLLRALSTISPPDSGTITWDGVPLRREDMTQRRRLMFLPDVPPLIYGETVLQNLAMLLRLYEADRPEAIPRLFELLKEFEILSLAERGTGELSRGQSYKVALTGLLAVDPDLWLLDEPFASGMDPAGLHALRRHARAAVERGRTVLFTTQILEAAESLADTLCLLHEGRVRAFGPLAEIKSRAGGDLFTLMTSLREERGETSA